MKIFISFFIVFAFVTLAEAQSKKELKEEATQKEYEKTRALIDSKSYVFSAEWATTQRGKRINLISNPGFLKIDHDKVEGDLPYFGVVQTASLTDRGGLFFENENIEYNIEFDDKKQRTVIKFKASNKMEKLNLILIIYKTGNANLNMLSNTRDGISYDGKIGELKK